MTSSGVSQLIRIAVIATVIGMSGLASAGAFEPVRAGAPVLVIAPPWSAGGAAAVLQAAGGREIAPMRAPFAALGVLQDPAQARIAGAWAVWDAGAFARLCGIEFDQNGTIGDV